MKPAEDVPLPATLWFVFSVGAIILAGWIGMYILLRTRW